MSGPLFEDELQKLVLLAQKHPPQPSRSAFKPFLEASRRFRKDNSSSMNMRKRMMEFMRNDWSERMASEKQRSAKHMINERMRRERERHCFFDLHSVLPSGTRNEKISIIQKAADEIRKLEKRKQELQNQHLRMEKFGKEGEAGRREKPTAKIRLGMEDRTTGMGSLEEVLKCFKHMGMSAKSIGLDLSNREFTAEIEFEVENEMEAAQVEAVVRTAMYEAGT